MSLAVVLAGAFMGCSFNDDPAQHPPRGLALPPPVGLITPPAPNVPVLARADEAVPPVPRSVPSRRPAR